jgi:hypothetical protein
MTEQNHPLDGLAREVYRCLVRAVRAGPSLTYGELAAAVSEKSPIHPRSGKLHAALGEVTAACRRAELPALPAIVWKSGANRPSDGYYKVAYPRVRSFKAQLAAWQEEHQRVIAHASWPKSP